MPSTAYFTFLTCTAWSMSLVVSYIPTTDLDTQNVYTSLMPIPVAKAWVCVGSLTGIAGSISVGGMDVSLLSMLCVVKIQASARDQSLAQRSPTECVRVIQCDQVQQ